MEYFEAIQQVVLGFPRRSEGVAGAASLQLRGRSSNLCSPRRKVKANAPRSAPSAPPTLLHKTHFDSENPADASESIYGRFLVGYVASELRTKRRRRKKNLKTFTFLEFQGKIRRATRELLISAISTLLKNG